MASDSSCAAFSISANGRVLLSVDASGNLLVAGEVRASEPKAKEAVISRGGGAASEPKAKEAIPPASGVEVGASEGPPARAPKEAAEAAVGAAGAEPEPEPKAAVGAAGAEPEPEPKAAVGAAGAEPEPKAAAPRLAEIGFFHAPWRWPRPESLDPTFGFNLYSNGHLVGVCSPQVTGDHIALSHVLVRGWDARDSARGFVKLLTTRGVVGMRRRERGPPSASPPGPVAAAEEDSRSSEGTVFELDGPLPPPNDNHPSRTVVSLVQRTCGFLPAAGQLLLPCELLQIHVSPWVNPEDVLVFTHSLGRPASPAEVGAASASGSGSASAAPTAFERGEEGPDEPASACGAASRPGPEGASAGHPPIIPDASESTARQAFRERHLWLVDEIIFSERIASRLLVLRLAAIGFDGPATYLDSLPRFGGKFTTRLYTRGRYLGDSPPQDTAGHLCLRHVLVCGWDEDAAALGRITLTTPRGSIPLRRYAGGPGGVVFELPATLPAPNLLHPVQGVLPFLQEMYARISPQICSDSPLLAPCEVSAIDVFPETAAENVRMFTYKIERRAVAGDEL
jgi:hypothetical protein